ncbi:response regulator [Oricola sp.]|uniref:response regulator n=1 Tax=Oricola sp. TaxID=1979950 RepID=UPI0025E731B6|nr:response regulator [Oricola sp.]MCI5074852.1 hypothetical protein [Oricola sp.]
MLSGKSILIVEEAALIAVDIETVLGELGAAQVVTMGGGETPLPASVKDGAIDLAILDISTAASRGDDLSSTIDKAGAPVIFLTTDPQVDAVPDFGGRFQTVQKPFTYEELCGALARLMA